MSQWVFVYNNEALEFLDITIGFHPLAVYTHFKHYAVIILSLLMRVHEWESTIGFPAYEEPVAFDRTSWSIKNVCNRFL